MNSRSRSQTSSSSSSDRQTVGASRSRQPGKIKALLSSLFGKKGKNQKLEEEYLKERDVKKVIRLYSKYENLWNPKESFYGNRAFAEDCYNEMAKSIPRITGYELKALIEQLRYKFEQEYRAIENARWSRGEELTPTLGYYNEFLFLVPCLCMEDFNRCHAESGTSLQNSKYVTKPRSSDSPNNPFMGFPLAAFPGNISCTPKDIFKGICRQTTRDSKQMVTFSHCGSESRDSKLSLASSFYCDEKEIKITDLACPFNLGNNSLFRPTTILRQQESMKSPPESNSPLGQETSMKSNSKHYPTESFQRENSDPACHRHMKSHVALVHPLVQQTSVKSNSKNPSESFQKGNTGTAYYDHLKSSYQTYRNSARNSEPAKTAKPMKSIKTCAQSFAGVEKQKLMHTLGHCSNAVGQQNSPQKERSKEAAVETKPDNALLKNLKQVQMLCDMIRTELTAAPDFIYFDAKWRIIEILREVHKRQLVYLKAGPQKIATKQQLNQLMMQHHAHKPSKNSTVKKQGSRVCEQINSGHCPYCCCHHN